MSSPLAKPVANSRGNLVFEAIAKSDLFVQFFRLVDSLTGLKPALVDCGGEEVLPCPRTRLNKFCRIIDRTPEGVAACRRCDTANVSQCGCELRIYQCHAGLMDICVPILVSGEHAASILCGQVLTRAPDERGFQAVLRRIRGIPVDAAELRRAYFATPVVPFRQLKRMAQMIAFFAGYLSEIGSRLALLEQKEERECIRAARQYMSENFHAPLTLKEVAGVVALSPKYFSRLFAREVGESYIRQLNRMRIAKAKEQLLHPHVRVSDVAARCGFESIPHFNRVFRSLEKLSPTDFRRTARGASSACSRSAKKKAKSA
ncbi:MAG: PocR ligand-binding domain-containing protein [Thermoguttaceae bacterium]|jgi:AraC-like DNA-binding protein/ligand-binding sensor protein